MKEKLVNLVILITLLFSFSVPAFAEENEMTLNQMEAIVKELASESEGEKGRVKFVYQNVLMYLISDPIRNRMRIIAPITKYSDLDKAIVDAAMISNFSLALDARYAVREGILFSAYVHPLKELTEKQIQSAIRQVSSLAITFGNGYTSGEMVFGVKPKEKPIH